MIFSCRTTIFVAGVPQILQISLEAMTVDPLNVS
jgi:hypothetical protein